MNYRRGNSLELCAVMMRLPRAPIRASSLGGDGLTCLERARRSQPADRRLAHAIAARQIGLHSALGEPLDRFLALMGSERLRTSKTHATGFGALPAVVRTRSDTVIRRIARPTHGYAETREAAMAAFAKSWRRE